MRIAFDIHGTLDDDPLFVLKEIFNSMLMCGHEVFIISGPPTDQIKKELKALSIPESSVTIISIVDWLLDKKVKMSLDSKGNWWCDEFIWWSSKGNICRNLGIDAIFDDKIEYKANMPETTKFIQW